MCRVHQSAFLIYFFEYGDEFSQFPLIAFQRRKNFADKNVNENSTLLHKNSFHVNKSYWLINQ